MAAWFDSHQATETPGAPVYAGRSLSMRVSSFTQEMFPRFSRQGSVANGVGDDEYDLCCFPIRWGRSRKAESGSSGLLNKGGQGSAFARLDADRDKPKVGRAPRSRSSSCGCCGFSRRSGKWKVDGKKKPGSKDRLRTGGRWEVDGNEEYFKPPIWKQIIRKMRAHIKRAHGTRCEWVNYDLQSYEKNFDNGGWRDSYSFQSLDERDNLGTKERALHSALLQKFASSKSQDLSAFPLPSLPIPAPVPPLSKEEFVKSKEEFVPIWQRRAAIPPSRLDLRKRNSEGRVDEG